MTQKASTSSASAERRARSLLGVGATASVLGIALSAAGSSDLTAWLTVAALGLLIYAVHAFGRTGADAPAGTKRRRAVRTSGA